MLLSQIYVGLIAVWAASELWLALRRRSTSDAQSLDGGTLRMLQWVIYASIGIGVWLSYRQPWPWPEPPRHALFLAGLVLMAAGLLFRFWSIHVLGRHFTVDVAIGEDHRIVRHGPYRWLRHPSYTGALATFFGFGLCLGDVAALACVGIPVTAAFLRRIRVEERVLARAFPVDYPAYARETRRLLPGIW